MLFNVVGADINKKTSGSEHTVLSLACAGGHASVVELLLARGSNPSVKLKVNYHFFLQCYNVLLVCSLFIEKSFLSI